MNSKVMNLVKTIRELTLTKQEGLFLIGVIITRVREFQKVDSSEVVPTKRDKRKQQPKTKTEKRYQ